MLLSELEDCHQSVLEWKEIKAALNTSFGLTTGVLEVGLEEVVLLVELSEDVVGALDNVVELLKAAYHDLSF